MAHYLTIPDVTEYEELVSLNPGMGDHSFNIVINADATAMWLFQAASDARTIPLVVLVTDAMMIALDDVVVASSSASPVGADDPHVQFELNAGAVRYV